MFSHISEESNLTLTNEILRQELNRERDEMSIIDGASAVLSSGNGKSVNIY